MEPTNATNDRTFADVGAAWDAWLQTQYWPSWRDHIRSLIAGRADAAVRFRGYVQGAALARSEAAGTPPPWETGELPPLDDVLGTDLETPRWDLAEFSPFEPDKLERFAGVPAHFGEALAECHPAAGVWLEGFLDGYEAASARVRPPAA